MNPRTCGAVRTVDVDAPTIVQNVGVSTIAKNVEAAEMSESRQFVLLYRAVARSKTKFLYHVKQKSFERRLSFERASRSNGRRCSDMRLPGVIIQGGDTD
jgi:hypothetical protein